MKKKGGLKRKISIEKRETKAQRSVTCNKRRRTIFSKAADLCRLSGANIAVFVTSPAESSNVVYSFSGYSPASEIADCYFNGKPPPKKINPQAKIGLMWEDPNLYRNCDDISELNIIEDRLKRLKKYMMECLEKKEKLQLASTSSLDDITYGSDQNPNFSLDQIYGEPSSSQVDQNPNVSLDQIYGERSFSRVYQNTSSSVEDIFQGGSSSSSDQSCGFKNGTCFGFTDGLSKQRKRTTLMSLTQETQTEPKVHIYEECFY